MTGEKLGGSMSRRGAGIAFITIAAFLYATRYITAAIFGTGFSSWNSEIFTALLSYVDQGLTSLSVTALAAGIAYLVWAELGALRGKNRIQ
jgi:hypothetical protein